MNSLIARSILLGRLYLACGAIIVVVLVVVVVLG
jgi:hypothetical protein